MPWCQQTIASAFHAACRSGDCDSAAMVLRDAVQTPWPISVDDPLDPPAAGLPGQAWHTPLMLAAARGFTDLAGLLLDHGATVDLVAPPAPSWVVGGQWSALHHAAAGGHADVARMLVARGALAAGVNATMSSCGFTPVHIAAQYGQTVVLRAVLEALSSPAATSSPSVASASESPHVAGEEETAASGAGSAALVARAFANAAATPDGSSRTALHIAAANGWADAICALLPLVDDVNAADDLGFSALGAAASAGHYDAARVLLDKGFAAVEDAGSSVVPSARHGGGAVTAVAAATAAVASGSSGGGAAATTTTNGGGTKSSSRFKHSPLRSASKHGHGRVVELLLQRRADPDAIAPMLGLSALILAAQYGHSAVVRLLLAAGADVDYEPSHPTALRRTRRSSAPR